MAEEKNEAQLKAEKKKIQDEKKKLKNDQKAHQKEAKKRAKELADQEAELEDQSKSGGFSVFMVTLFIILIWLVILGIIIKLDVGGIGSNVMAPLLKNVPVLNKILPADSITETDDLEAYYGYTSLSDAVDQIKALEMELTNARNANTTNISEIERLKAEVERLQTFEQQQVEFARIKTEFYESVIYAENGPGPDAFIQYFESIDKATAEELYKQVIKQKEVDEAYSDYADAYAQMDPAAAAAIFNTMDNNLDLVANILKAMSANSRGNILAKMDANIAAQVTKLMNPEN